MLIASECFKKNVVAKDNEMGLFVNIVFDKESREARMVVFPKLGSHASGLLKSLGSIGSRAFSSVSYELSDVVGSEASGILSDTVYEASRKIDEKQYDKTQKTSGLYFLLPVSEISAVKDDKILLEKSIEEYGLYLCMRGTESDVALFNDEMFKETGRYNGISISLVSVRGLGLKDPDGNKGRIVDAVFGTQEGTVSHLVVATIGKGSKNRFVPVDIVDFMGMTVSKKLEDCPESLPS